MVMLADDLSDVSPPIMKEPLPAGSGTIPAMPGSPALTFKPIEDARGLWTLYGYWNSAKANGAPLYYQWTYNQSAPRLPNTPPPPMGQFPTLDAARAAMMAQLSIQSPILPPAAQPAAPRSTTALPPVASPVIPPNYATMPFPADEIDTGIPTWAKVALGTAAVGAIILLLLPKR